MEYEWNIYILTGNINGSIIKPFDFSGAFKRAQVPHRPAGDIVDDIVPGSTMTPFNKMKLECLTEVPHVYRLLSETYGKFKESTGFVPSRSPCVTNLDRMGASFICLCEINYPNAITINWITFINPDRKHIYTTIIIYNISHKIPFTSIYCIYPPLWATKIASAQSCKSCECFEATGKS